MTTQIKVTDQSKTSVLTDFEWIGNTTHLLFTEVDESEDEPYDIYNDEQYWLAKHEQDILFAGL